MKIKLISGKIADTSDMSDIQAMLAEKSYELVQEFLKYKVPFLLRWYNPSDNTVGGSCNFNHRPDDFLKVVLSINHFLEKDLKTRLQIIDTTDINNN